MAKGKMDLSTFVGKLLEEQDADVLREGIRVLTTAAMFPPALHPHTALARLTAQPAGVGCDRPDDGESVLADVGKEHARPERALGLA